ncbi:MAG: 50S ribosomal protein L7ae-like protein [Clostridiales bacterium]|nr:50S ribosomal protein L7ae-like protein [Clostridiales bacterium]
MLEALKESNKLIGVKQTTKALKEDNAKTLFIAEDADEHVVANIKKIAKKKSVEIIYVDSMQELGRACGIDVGAAAAAILK